MWHLLLTVEKQADTSLLLEIFLPLKDYCVSGYAAAHGAVNDLTLIIQREPLTSLLVLFPVPVCLQCTSSV